LTGCVTIADITNDLLHPLGRRRLASHQPRSAGEA
jgi:hypothetical protein